MLFLKKLLPQVSLLQRAVAFTAGIALAGLTGCRLWPWGALVVQISAAGVFLYYYLQGAWRFHADWGLTDRREPAVPGRPSPIQPLSLQAGRVQEGEATFRNRLYLITLALWLVLGFCRQGAAAWPALAGNLPEGLVLSGLGRVVQADLLAESGYTGARVRLTVALTKRRQVSDLEATGHEGFVAGVDALWQRQQKILLTVTFPKGAAHEAAKFSEKALPGAIVNFQGRLRQTAAPHNPGEMDYRAYLASQGIYCQVAAAPEQVGVERGAGLMGRWPAMLRQAISQGAARHLAERERGVVLGCLLGDQGGIAPEDQQVYRQAGVAHLFAVSGTHGGILLGIVLQLEGRLASRRSKNALRLLGLALLLFYLCLTGFPLSMQRTFVMACVLQLAAFSGRQSDSRNSLGLAALLLLWRGPQQLFAAGFQLSFGVTLGLLHLSPWLAKKLPQGLAVPVAAQGAALPLQAYWFYQIQPFGFLINLWAVALMPPLLTLAGLGAICGDIGGLGSLFWQAAGFVALLLDRSCAAWVTLPYAFLHIKARPWPVYALWGLGIAALPKLAVWEKEIEGRLYLAQIQESRRQAWGQWQLWRQEKLDLAKGAAARGGERQGAGGQEYCSSGGSRFGGTGIADSSGDGGGNAAAAGLPSGRGLGYRAGPAPVFTPQVKAPFAWRLWCRRRQLAVFMLALAFLLWLWPRATLTVHFLDVGQGDGIVLEMPTGSVWLLDGGSSSVSSLADYRLAPFLRSRGINRLDFAVVSHPDNDHISGLRELLATWPVGCLVMAPQALVEEGGQALADQAAAKGVELLILYQGQAIRDGKVVLHCLSPSLTDEPDVNRASLVLHLAYKDFSLLLTGDIDSQVEEGLKGVWGKVNLLKVAHHGSATGSSAGFLAAIRPEVAVISAGKNNFYGHPSPAVLTRLAEADCLIYNTADQGGIQVQTDGKKMKIKTFMSAQKAS